MSQLRTWILRALVLDVAYRVFLRTWVRERIGMESTPPPRVAHANDIALLESWWALPTYEREAR